MTTARQCVLDHLEARGQTVLWCEEGFRQRRVLPQPALGCDVGQAEVQPEKLRSFARRGQPRGGVCGLDGASVAVGREYVRADQPGLIRSVGRIGLHRDSIGTRRYLARKRRVPAGALKSWGRDVPERSQQMRNELSVTSMIAGTTRPRCGPWVGMMSKVLG